MVYNVANLNHKPQFPHSPDWLRTKLESLREKRSQTSSGHVEDTLRKPGVLVRLGLRAGDVLGPGAAFDFSGTLYQNACGAAKGFDQIVDERTIDFLVFSNLGARPGDGALGQQWDLARRSTEKTVISNCLADLASNDAWAYMGSKAEFAIPKAVEEPVRPVRRHVSHEQQCSRSYIYESKHFLFKCEHVTAA